MHKRKLTTKEAFILASQNYQKNDFKTAQTICIKILNGNPKHLGSLIMLGSISSQTKKIPDAFLYYKKAIYIDPNNKIALNNLSVLLRDTDLNYIVKVNRSLVKELLILLFKRKDIDHKDIFFVARFLIFKEEKYNQFQIEKILNSNSKLLKSENIKNLLKDELFLLMLQKSLAADIFLEKILTKLRYEIISIFFEDIENFPCEFLDFTISLAEQCFLNEYIYSQNKKEINFVNQLKNDLENKKDKLNELKIAILGCYVPLYHLKIISNKLLDYKSSSALFNDFIKFQIKEPLLEKKIISSIKSLTKISNPISQKVQDQYEQNPYPRWRYTYSNVPSNIQNIVNTLIKPNEIKFNNKFDNPSVLIAGCGTGKQILLAAEGYLNASILGVDLSLSSLAYAKRKIEELSLKNVELLHADILDLKKLNKLFDVIECVGVLHHMDNPLEGLKILLNLLKPHGLLRLGLYSEIARKDIIKVRELIKKKEFKNSNEDIKKCRQRILAEKNDKIIKKVIYRTDFYSASAARDLIFHIKEHRFTLEKLSKIFKNLNLEFLGFTNVSRKDEFTKLFPGDKNNIYLDNWHKFELNNEDTFLGMYNFWTRKLK